MPTEPVVQESLERLRVYRTWLEDGHGPSPYCIENGTEPQKAEDLRGLLAELDTRASIQKAYETQHRALQAQAVKLSALEGVARSMLWDGGGRPDHMTACERTMGDTHACTCGAEAFRKSLGHSPTALASLDSTGEGPTQPCDVCGKSVPVHAVSPSECLCSPECYQRKQDSTVPAGGETEAAWTPFSTMEPKPGGKRDLAIKRLGAAKNIQQTDVASGLALVSRSDLIDLFHQWWWTIGVARHLKEQAEQVVPALPTEGEGKAEGRFDRLSSGHLPITAADLLALKDEGAGG